MKTKMDGQKIERAPFTIAQVLANLENCANEMEQFDENLEAGPGYVKGILGLILSLGIVPDAPGKPPGS